MLPETDRINRQSITGFNRAGALVDPDTFIETTNLVETAAGLLLRSPNLSVSQILDLLDIGDAEFREMSTNSEVIRNLLEQRRNGELRRSDAELKTCPGCGEWYLPYAGSRVCSDECGLIVRIQKAQKGSEPFSGAISHQRTGIRRKGL